MKTFTLLAATAMLSACSGGGDTDRKADADSAATATATEMQAPEPRGVLGAPTDAATYIAKAGAGDMWEIESSNALLAKSKRDDVKAFARMMVDNHGKSTAKLKAAARSAVIDVPAPKLDAAQQKMLDEIKNADAATVDAVYLRHQQKAHEAAFALHRAYATNGDTDSLKTAADEIAPVVEQHIVELQKLAKTEPASAQ